MREGLPALARIRFHHSITAIPAWPEWPACWSLPLAVGLYLRNDAEETSFAGSRVGAALTIAIGWSAWSKMVTRVVMVDESSGSEPMTVRSVKFMPIVAGSIVTS